MDWFMIAFIVFLCVVLAFYIHRQLNDPGVDVFPFNYVDDYPLEGPEVAATETE